MLILILLSVIIAFFLSFKLKKLDLLTSLKHTKKASFIPALKLPNTSFSGFDVSQHLLSPPIIFLKNCKKHPLPAPSSLININSIDLCSGYWNICAIHILTKLITSS